MFETEPVFTKVRSDHTFALSHPSLDPLFWQAERLGARCAWWGHVPAAHWLIGAVRPELFVELGTYSGVSYSAFCEGIIREDLPTRCFAVDTWSGDEHAGTYSEDVYREFKASMMNDIRGFPL